MPVTYRKMLLALSALSLPVAAAAQKAQPMEPIDLPPSVEQGVDMIYVDPEIAPRIREQDVAMHQISFEEWAGAPLDLFVPVNPIYTELRRGLVRYNQRWGGLPEVRVPTGAAALKAGSSGQRVALLRERLGLGAGDVFDEALAAQVKQFQADHGLKADGVAGNGTINALNLGSKYYERLIIVNLERARRLPLATERRRYVIVDAGEGRLNMYENGRVVDTMKVIVGAKETATPMMAALLKYASVNPYWNVPPELVTKLIAPRVVSQGVSYLAEREYEVLSDWSKNPQVLDPETIDWPAVVEGRQEVRLRRKPSPANSMGGVKFMMPNDFGIYLHDTPDKSYFAKNDLWISNGCVRLEDAKRFGDWLYGRMPKGDQPKVEKDVPLDEPVPVYLTYLTVGATREGVKFRPDPYGRDAAVIARYFGSEQIASTEVTRR